MKSFLINLKGRIWFVPSVYSLLSLIMAFVTIMIDYYWAASMKEYLPPFMMTKIDLAQTVLSTIAGSLLTMTTFTFSTVMVVLTTYSSQFSPRALKHFVNDKKTVRGLGVFMGGFIYSITTLLFMRDTPNEEFVIAAFFGVLYAIVCLAYFAYFIHHVATSIQISSLIGRLEKDAMKIVNFYKELQKNNVVQEQKKDPGQFLNKKEVCSKKSGFLQFVDYEGLLECTEKNGLFIDFEIKVGNFIRKGQPLYTIYSQKESIEDLSEYLSFGSERMGKYDLEFSLQRISEIAVRAVSPSINDPNTARDCIRYLGVLLGDTAELNDGHLTMVGKDTEPRVRIPFFEFDRMLYKSYYQIVHYAKQDVSVILALLEAMVIIQKEMPEGRQETVYSFHEYILRNINKEEMHKWDLQFLNEKINELEGEMK
ncbi:DUF2254 domain-containing protein [Rossellomorea aquimaris]|uniref:DUF2254 domain-containing protein n=1 Tax=Rossellomorea aquimaris TaxID=189382 RepID=A0A5D4TV00_9BACI|nr:DUF2254 domain-containing protein [Rossellomorea aquimaris]TYS78074.1 DUF2254 domain-containing protein [Rossellomorea aquimaris]